MINTNELECAIEAQAVETSQLRYALGLAVDMLMEHEPGDSLAVSDVVVALASIACRCDNAVSWAIINMASVSRQRETQ
jgi:hypothetical protein